jgi:hypothetical protein
MVTVKNLIDFWGGGRGVVVEFGLSFTLAKEVPYHFSQASSPFCSGYFSYTVSLLAQTSLDHNLPL